jgi:plasmid stabilization system protein ParE
VTATLIVQPEAETDLDGAFRWYEARRIGLGDEFLQELAHAFQRVAKQPSRYAIVHRGTRRALLRRFPYVVLYVARERKSVCSC